LLDTCDFYLLFPGSQLTWIKEAGARKRPIGHSQACEVVKAIGGQRRTKAWL